GGSVVFHSFRKRLFDVGIATSLNRFYRVQGMLKIGRTDNYTIQILHGIQLIIVSECLYLVSQLLLQKTLTFFSSQLPQIGNGYYFKIQFFIMIEERWKQGASESV